MAKTKLTPEARKQNRQVCRPAESRTNPITEDCFPKAEELSKWYSTEQNRCLAEVAEMEVGTEDILVNDVTGLEQSQMYALAIRKLGEDWVNHYPKFALSFFAARMFCAGRILGRREPIRGEGYAE